MLQFICWYSNTFSVCNAHGGPEKLVLHSHFSLKFAEHALALPMALQAASCWTRVTSML
jgi:hypothetical protein